MMKFFATLLLVLSMTGCGGGSNDGNPGATSGVITLSGDNAAIVGTQLDTGNVGSSLAAGSQPDYIVIVDQASSVTFTEPNILTPNLSNPNNGFVLVVTDDAAGSGIKGISMSIFKGGEKFDYACTAPVSTFTDCGTDSIDLDIENKTVTFTNATVLNTGTDSVLTLDGTLTWSENNGSSTTEPEKISNSLTLTGNDVGAELVRDLILDITETRSDAGDVNGFIINNSNSSNGTNTFVDISLYFDATTGYYAVQLLIANSVSDDDWSYECDDDPSNEISECDGKITINEDNRTFTFENVILLPTTGVLSDSDQSTAPLTVNGKLIWPLN